MIKCTHFKCSSMSLTNIFTGVTNIAIEISKVSITLKNSLMIPAIHSPSPRPRPHTPQISGNHWSSVLSLLPALEFLTNGIICFGWPHAVVHIGPSFLQLTGIPFLWPCHNVYPFLLLKFKRTVLSYTEVGQRKVKTRVNRKIFIWCHNIIM